MKRPQWDQNFENHTQCPFTVLYNSKKSAYKFVIALFFHFQNTVSSLYHLRQAENYCSKNVSRSLYYKQPLFGILFLNFFLLKIVQLTSKQNKQNVYKILCGPFFKMFYVVDGFFYLILLNRISSDKFSIILCGYTFFTGISIYSFEQTCHSTVG